MAIARGARIGSYEVISRVGSGGMGEVCLARDTELGRSVALKVIPDLFASDAERLARGPDIIVVQNWAKELKSRVPVK